MPYCVILLDMSSLCHTWHAVYVMSCVTGDADPTHPVCRPREELPSHLHGSHSSAHSQ